MYLPWRHRRWKKGRLTEEVHNAHVMCVCVLCPMLQKINKSSSLKCETLLEAETEGQSRHKAAKGQGEAGRRSTGERSAGTSRNLVATNLSGSTGNRASCCLIKWRRELTKQTYVTVARQIMTPTTKPRHINNPMNSCWALMTLNHKHILRWIHHLHVDPSD